MIPGGDRSDRNESNQPSKKKCERPGSKAKHLVFATEITARAEKGSGKPHAPSCAILVQAEQQGMTAPRANEFLPT